MNLLDTLLLVLAAVSVLIGLIRGFGREVISLVSWVLALMIAARAVPQLMVHVEGLLGSTLLEQVLIFLAVFMAVVLLGALVNSLVGSAIRGSGFSGVDRLFGLFFGVARAALLSALLFFAAGLTTWPEHAVWRDSSAVAVMTPILCDAPLQERLQTLQPRGWLAERMGDEIDWGAVCRQADTLDEEQLVEGDPIGF